MLKVKRWSKPATIAFSLLFIAIMCFTLLPSPVQIGPLSFGGAGVAQAAVTYTNQAATKDAEVWAYYPTTNYGSATTLREYNDAVTPNLVRSIIEFDISDFPSGITQETATLSVYVASYCTGSSGYTVDCKRTTSSWTEGAVTWDTKPTTTDTDKASATAPASGWMSFNVLTLSQDAIANRSGIFSVILVLNPESGANCCPVAWSSEYATTSLRPKIEITYSVGPLITTNAATSITTISATLNGEVVSIYTGGNVTSYGFILSTTSVPTNPGNVSPSAQTTYTAGNWTYTAPGGGYAAGQTFNSNGNVTGLTPCTRLYFRTGGYNTAGWAWGDELYFDTLLAAAEVGWIADEGGDEQSSRIKVEISENGGGAVNNYTAMFDALYNGSVVEEDSINQFLYRPGTRYVGVHDRTYIVNVSSAGVLSIRQWDEDDLTLSNTVTLATSLGSDDHNGGSVEILQHQSGSLSGENGTVMVIYCVRAGGIYSIRSDNSEDISSWGDINTATTTIANFEYPTVIELANGTVMGFYHMHGVIYYQTMTVASNPDDDSWGTAQALASYEAAPYYKLWYDGTDIHFTFMHIDGPPYDSLAYHDVMYAKMTGFNAGVATSTSANELIASGATFQTWAMAAEWWVLNTTDNTIAKVTAVNSEGNLTLDANIFANGEGFLVYCIKDAAGTLKHLPMDGSAAAHIPQVVHTSGVGHGSVIWDIKVDGSNNPNIIYCDGTVLAGDFDIFVATYSGGAWNVADTGINTHIFGTLGTLLAGAELDPSNVNLMCAAVDDISGHTQIQMYENVSGTWYIADGSHGTTAVVTDGKITQASPGDNFRPIYIRNGAGHFKYLWFYSERYENPQTFSGWESMRLAYPGFSSDNHLCLNKVGKTDFGDLRLTRSDGTTLQPSATSGKPWIQEKTDSWRAIVWWNTGNLSLACNNTVYVYFGDSSETNANTQAIMDSQFLACDSFGNGTTLDTAKWTLTNTVTVASGNLVLTATATDGDRGTIDQNVTNYPLYTYAEVQFKAKGSDTKVGDYCYLGLRGTGSYNEIEAYLWSEYTADALVSWIAKGGSASYATEETMDTDNWHVLKIDWTPTAVNFYTDLISGTQRTATYNVASYTNTAYISTSSQGLHAREGDKVSGVVYVDWIFSRPIPSNGSMPKVSALTQELIDISNTPSTWSVGIVQPSQTYWANGAEPGWPLGASNCWGNLTNNSSFAVGISASMTNMTGGTTWSIGSSPGTNVFTLKIGIAGLAGVGNFTTLSNTPVVWITSMAAGNMTRWTMVFYTPTNTPQFADGAPKSGTITFEAEAS